MSYFARQPQIANYLCFYFVKSKMAAKMATMFGDGTGLQ